MTKIQQLVARIDALAERRGCAVSTLSRKIFNDGKAVDRLRAGGDVVTSTYDLACNRLDELEKAADKERAA